MADILKLIYIVPELGEYAVTPDGAVVNIGGVKGPTFTVGGKPLMFADGTSTGPGSSDKPTLQSVYDNVEASVAQIDFTSGKHFILNARNQKTFKFDADTGDVNIDGNITASTVNGIDIVALSEQVNSTNSIKGFEYVQGNVLDTWLIIHQKGSLRVEVTIWDENNEQVLPDHVQIMNENIVKVTFNTPQAGRAILPLF